MEAWLVAVPARESLAQRPGDAVLAEIVVRLTKATPLPPTATVAALIP